MLITAGNLRHVPPLRLEQVFSATHHLKFGAAIAHVESDVVAWFWALYASSGGGHLLARRRAVDTLRDMHPAAIRRAPVVDDRGAVVEIFDLERPFAPAVEIEMVMARMPWPGDGRRENLPR